MASNQYEEGVCHPEKFDYRTRNSLSTKLKSNDNYNITNHVADLLFATTFVSYHVHFSVSQSGFPPGLWWSI